MKPQAGRWRTAGGQLERLCGCGEWKPHTVEFFTWNSPSHGQHFLSTRCRAQRAIKSREHYAAKGRAGRRGPVATCEAVAAEPEPVVKKSWTFPGVDNATMDFLHLATAQWPTHPEGLGFSGR